MKIDELDRRRAEYVNSDANPYRRKEWDAGELETRAAALPKEMIEPWVRTILHLQRISWKFHSILCEAPDCDGCGTDVIKCAWHQKQAEIICYDGKECWAVTGRRFGKTKAMTFKSVCAINGYNPLTNELTATPVNAWLVGLDHTMVRDAIVPTFVELMPPEEAKWSGDSKAWEYKKVDLVATVWNKSWVGFKSCESGRGKFQSVGLDFIQFDEEPPKDIYRESTLRLRGGKKLRIWGAMTPDPVAGLTWTYRDILKNDARQADPSMLKVWTGRTNENPWLDKEEVAGLYERYTDWERSVVLEGNYDIGHGRCAFDIVTLRKILDACTDPGKELTLRGCQVKLWDGAVPGAQYIVSGDPAEGLEHGDNSAGHILRRDTMTVVGTVVGRVDPDTFGLALVDISRMFNDAWLIVEANNHGLTTIKAVQGTEYSNVYAERSQERLGMTESRRSGWHTNIMTRPIMVDALATVIRDGSLTVPCRDTVEECTTFTINAKGKAEAQQGCRDDRVMSLALAVQGHLRCPLDEPVPDRQELPRPSSWWDEEPIDAPLTYMSA